MFVPDVPIVPDVELNITVGAVIVPPTEILLPVDIVVVPTEVVLPVIDTVADTPLEVIDTLLPHTDRLANGEVENGFGLLLELPAYWLETVPLIVTVLPAFIVTAPDVPAAPPTPAALMPACPTSPPAVVPEGLPPATPNIPPGLLP